MAQLMSIKRNVEMCHGQVSVQAIYHVSQGDKGTRIILGLVNNSANYTIPDGTTATIRGHRADGTLFTEITADVETTEVKFNLTEDMSAVPGRAECEAVLASGSANIIGTANFIIDVEKSPASIGSVFPATDAAETWLIDELTNLDISGLDNESVVDAINNKTNESTIAPEFDPSGSYTAGQYVYKNGVLYRFTSAHSGAWTGTDAVEVTVEGEIKRIGSGSGLTESIKTALLACFEKVAWIDEDGQDYYDALYDALYPPADLVSISAVFTQGSAVIYDTDSLDTLKQYLVVTAHMSDSSTRTVTTYALSGTLTAGTSTITVSYGGKTTMFNVSVTHESTTYVTDGLIARWDGIENTLNGHDSTATVWKDLAGTYDIAVPSGSATWDTDGLTLTGLQARNVVSSNVWSELTYCTIEAVVIPTGTGTQRVVAFDTGGSGARSKGIDFYSDNTIGVFGQSSNTYSNTQSALTAIKHIAVVYNSMTSVSKVLINGGEALQSANTHSLRHNAQYVIVGNSDSGTAYLFTGKICAMRVYNRQLSDAELANNRVTDIERFGLVV